MIELKNVTKTYPGQSFKAVDNLSMIMETGEITVLVGPSGCGKSTTIRLVNGMIETTSGDVFIDGKNIKDTDPNRLRMNIGYVIQHIGLLPHLTIAQNIAIVPKLHGWDKELIDKRVVELLELVGLDPEITKNKFPLQLSGGQMQRVGVARAMAVDPTTMLMDEPFGAVDPITRRGLQDEFLRLQTVMKKTICFVTHDINEAVKMGDKIAIMNKGQIVQYDTPKNILSHPANDFVQDFIGADRMVKKLNILLAEQIIYPIEKTLRINESELPRAFDLMREKGGYHVACFIDDAGRAVGLITKEMEKKLEGNFTIEGLKDLIADNQKAAVHHDTNLSDVFSQMLEHNSECVPVVRRDDIIGSAFFDDIRIFVNKEDDE
ncbi:MAG: ATP-binding cassette domain-containing protein [Dehalobacterium sp.]